jgi:copper chaperone
MMSEVFTVKGTSCGHCAGVLTAGIEELPGVREVSVDLRNGQLVVTSDHPLD